uniref:Uracil phosphoribosyltransferase n=1 Tax=Liagoropsis maxima TaxID=1653392 RepID=A0A1G4NW41_9FLOR|nr:Uracil phosphoribosyltransferase [Liagoropsis maxima]SCW22880.1 Uracil phosphoribosyltransferase [Liagoropsis maxima]
MSINIYTLKHPLVLNWISYLINPSLDKINKAELLNKLAIALLYEVTRKSIDVRNLYIKYLDFINEIYLISGKKIHLFCSDLTISQIITKDVTNLIPNLTVYPVILNWYNNLWDIIPNYQFFPETIQDNNIIIFEEELHAFKVSTIIKNILIRKGDINNIQICCITCTHHELEKLNNQYPNVHVYTATIINNYNI